MFHNAQEFYEHLDDCVLRVVQQEEPSEAINEQRLAEVANDPAVQESLDRQVPAASQSHGQHQDTFDEKNDEADDFKEEVFDDVWQLSSSRDVRFSTGGFKPRPDASS